MKTKLISTLVGLAVLVSAAISTQAQYITYGTYSYTIAPPVYVAAALVVYQTAVIYQQPVVYNAPVIYNGPVYYMNGTPPQYWDASCEQGRASYAGSSVFVMGGSGGSYGYANYGQCNPKFVVFGRRGGWFGR